MSCCRTCGGCERYKSGACVECAKGWSAAYYAANRAKVLARKAAYRSANRDKIRIYSAAYIAANHEKLRAYKAAYNAARRSERMAGTL